MRESTAPVRQDEVALDPGGVVARVLVQQGIHKLQLAVPESPSCHQRLPMRPAVVVLRVQGQDSRCSFELLECIKKVE